MFEKRFTMRDDGDGSWSVVDAASGLQAIVRDRTLVRLDEGDARDAADLLNLIAELRTRKPRQPLGMQPGLQLFLLPVR